MGALLVEHIGRDIAASAGDEVMGRALHQLLFERTKYLQRQ
jgi:hypothetical protein